MRERDIELYLKQQVERAGGLCWKFTSPGTRGVPDRVVVVHGHTHFVEVKAPGRKPSHMQEHRLAQLKTRGAHATWLDSKEAVDAFIIGAGALND